MMPWHFFKAQAALLGVPVSDLQVAQFEHFHALLVKANETTIIWIRCCICACYRLLSMRARSVL
jgi:hypothetical protein